MKDFFKNFIDTTLKFKKSNLPVIKIAFFALIIFAIFSIFNTFRLYPNKFSLKGYSLPIDAITMNVTFKQRLNFNPLFCFNDFCTSGETDNFNNVYSVQYNGLIDAFYENKVNQITFAYPKNLEKYIDNNIENIDLHVGSKDYYFNDSEINSFETKEIKISLDDTKEEQVYKALVLPKTVKSNYRGVLNHFCVLFLSLFYNWKFFLIPYLWLFVAAMLFVFNREEFNFKLPNKTYPVALGFVFVLAVVLRLNLFTYHPLWIDEIYTKTNAITSFAACFSDPGNPPLFFFLEFLMSKIFNNSLIVLRLLPFVFGILFIYCTFLFFKKINKNLALFSAFFAAINLINIYQSSEARSGSLCMLFCAALMYYLFNYLKDFKKKDLIIYSALAFLAVNTHYYLTVLVFVNFLWMIFSLLEDKKPSADFKNVIIANLVPFIGFLPYLIFTYKNSLSNEFNSWIPVLSTDTFKYIINEFFINKWIFLILVFVLLVLLVCSFVPKKYLSKINLEKNEQKENIFIYLIYSLALMLIVLSLVSIFVKPILHKRLLLSIYPLLMFLEIVSISTIFDFKNLNKYCLSAKMIYSTLLVLVCFSITKPMPLKDIYRIDSFMNFVLNDSKIYNEKGYEVFAVLPAKEEYLNNYPEVRELNYINWRFINPSSSSYLKSVNKKDFVEGDKKAVVYLSGLSADLDKITAFNPNAYLYQTNLGLNHFVKMKYDN